MSCERTKDCKYNCPPRMSDGRHYSDYRPRCVINYELQEKPMSSYDYRMYLQQNADKIITENRDIAWKNNLCGPCVVPDTMLPEQNVQVCNSRTCAFPQNDPTGLGLGRRVGGEQPSYRPSEQMTMKGCAIPAKDLNFYPINGEFQASL